MARSMTVSEFKAKCLATFDEIAGSGEEIVVTKRGRPVARIIAAAEPQPLAGSVSFHVSDEELVAPIDVRWDAEG
jgi:prevent-host-death family protein